MLLICITTVNCKRYNYKIAYPTLYDGKYDSEFPYKNCSDQLSDITKTVKRIFCVSKYKTYYFKEDQHVTLENLSQKILENKYFHSYTSDESSGGTGTIIYNEDRRIAILTCAHVVNNADTLITYYNQQFSFSPKYIYSISLKQSETIFANEIPEDKKLEVLCSDNKNDIAILGKTLRTSVENLPVFDYPLGNSKELEWGSFAYIVGHPHGRQMITRGIVSSPNFNEDGSYMIDALFNEGISGGLILAVKDGVPNFELVGIAKSVSVQHENFLKPEKESHEYIYNPNTPYDGKVYVSLKKSINYGLTFAVSTELIRNLYLENRSMLRKKGFRMDYLFNVDEEK